MTRIGGTLPLAHDEDIAVLGFRDEAEAFAHGGRPLPETILAVGEAQMRQVGPDAAIEATLARPPEPEFEGFWPHPDVDILSDALLPAADFPSPGGLDGEEPHPILAAAPRTGRVAVIGTLDAFNQAKFYASTNFNLSSVTVVAILFVIITIPQTRYVDWRLDRAARRVRG